MLFEAGFDTFVLRLGEAHREVTHLTTVFAHTFYDLTISFRLYVTILDRSTFDVGRLCHERNLHCEVRVRDENSIFVLVTERKSADRYVTEDPLFVLLERDVSVFESLHKSETANERVSDTFSFDNFADGHTFVPLVLSVVAQQRVSVETRPVDSVRRYNVSVHVDSARGEDLSFL